MAEETRLHPDAAERHRQRQEDLEGRSERRVGQAAVRDHSRCPSIVNDLCGDHKVAVAVRALHFRKASHRDDAQEPRLELLAVSKVVNPFTGGRDPLSGGYKSSRP